ncbi:unnamed protein product [Merluccius merluccius]
MQKMLAGVATAAGMTDGEAGMTDGEVALRRAMTGRAEREADVTAASAGKSMRKVVEGEEEGPAVDGKEREKTEKTAGAVSALAGEKRRMKTGGVEVRKGAESRVQQVGDRRRRGGSGGLGDEERES